MKTLFSFILPFIVISIIILAGCGNRVSLLDNAKISQSDIPVVLTVDPSSDRAGIPANPVVSVRFSIPMDTGSVESAFTLTVDGEVYTAGGVFEWLNGNRMFIYYPPSGSLPSGSLITATIDVTAKSILGIHLSTEYKWSFTPGYNFYSGNPSILSILPTALQAVLPTDLKIEIEFDRLMLHSTVESSFLLVSDSSDEDSRTSENGSFTWENMASGEKVSYMPNEALGNNNTYTLYLNNRGIVCRDLSGNALPNFATTFYTADTAIYVSNDSGDDANDGRNSAIPVQSLDTAITRAVDFKISLIKLEGEGSDPDYTGSFSVPSGITIEGGWNQSFDHQGYETKIIAGTTGQYAIKFSGVSRCTLDGLTIWGGEIPALENAGVLIQNSSDITIRHCYITASNLGTATEGYGIKIDNSSNITIDGNSNIIGGQASSRNAGVYVFGTSKNVTIKNNGYIEGGSSGTTYGILLGNGTGPVTIKGNTIITGGNVTSNNPTYGIYAGTNSTATIQDNGTIDAGSTSSNKTYGIYVDSTANAVIHDNTMISGGSTSNGDTNGISIANGKSVQIFRNIITGGEENTINPHINYGINANSVNECAVFNNFIIGSSLSTNNSNNSRGISSKDTNIYVINNTIYGGGNGGPNSHALDIEDSTGWSISPKIVNNIIIGGNNSSKYGIYFTDNFATLPLDCLVFNNTFKGEGTSLGGTNFTNIVYPAPPDSSTEIIPLPSDNLYYNTGSPDDLVFINDTAYNYHIDTINSSDTSSIKDNGYKNLSTLPLFKGNPSLLNELLIDIDGNTRNPASIDRGAHEFNP